MLGSEMIALGGRAARANELRAIAHDYLEGLAEATGETVTLEILRPDRDGIWHHAGD
jgi:DNA-binding IclR family transcriptional regulator